MNLWTFLFWCFATSVIFKLVKCGLDGDRDARLAKIDAKLKVDLVDRLGDPELVRRVVEARLPAGEDAEGMALESAPREPSPESKKEEDDDKVYVLVGLICFLIGVAFIVSRFATNIDALVIPGAVCGAVGLAFLMFASSHKEILNGGRKPDTANAESSRT